MKKVAIIIVSILLSHHVALYSKAAADKPTIIISFHTIIDQSRDEIEKRIRKSIGIGKGIGILFSGAPTEAEITDELFDITGKAPLAKISVKDSTWQTDYGPWSDEHKFGEIFKQYLASRTKADEDAINRQVKKELNKAYDIKKNHRSILNESAKYMFQSSSINETFEENPDMIALVQELKQKGYNIILLVGLAGATWHLFLENNPLAKSVTKIFPEDKIDVSGELGFVPTSPQMYKKIIKDQNLNPKTTIVIGSNKEDLRYPAEIGMKTLVFNFKKTNFDEFRKKLETALGTSL